MTKEIYILGSTGQLGGELQRLWPSALYVPRSVVDLTSIKNIQDFFKGKDPQVVINCAAFTQVDGAEKEGDLAYQINAIAPGELAKYCERFVHISSDYVFNGKASKPYRESSTVEPIGVYGRSKLKGEEYVLANNPKSVIIRTSWLYSDLGTNFVKTMLRLGSEKSEIGVVADQVGTPTAAFDLARLIYEHGLMDWNFSGGIYHFSNEGVASWYDFAREIMEIKGLNCRVLPIRTEDYPTPAQRPHYSVLDKSKIKNELGIVIPHWKESLKICLQKLS